MGTAYTPGLKVSSHATIEKLRRLPLKGTVLVEKGQQVEPHTVVARAELPGLLQTVKAADRLGVEPKDLQEILRIAKGDRVEKGDLIAETKGLFGRFFRGELRAPVPGIIEFLSSATGNIGIRQIPLPVERTAYIRGTVSDVTQGESVVIRCEGALIQGIFGVGGEQQGEISLGVSSPDRLLGSSDFSDRHRGKIVVGGSGISREGLRSAAEAGVSAVIVGGVIDEDLIGWLRDTLHIPDYDIGVAITGQEAVPFSLVVTEGFGIIPMAARTFRLLESLQGQTASLNGATQIRAGVIRPEVIVPAPRNQGDLKSSEHSPQGSSELKLGTPIRIIREPWFGALATVISLPPELTQVESETWVRILQARLPDGTTVVVPRANVEIIEPN